MKIFLLVFFILSNTIAVFSADSSAVAGKQTPAQAFDWKYSYSGGPGFLIDWQEGKNNSFSYLIGWDLKLNNSWAMIGFRIWYLYGVEFHYRFPLKNFSLSVGTIALNGGLYGVSGSIGYLFELSDRFMIESNAVFNTRLVDRIYLGAGLCYRFK